ncbi:MAG TPA: serine hydrolase domain-containing protein [Capsulimonadaceae bacterium]|nr:serine hydrolase domain-containing protein [Capsulimonadaceae bacterium]
MTDLSTADELLQSGLADGLYSAVAYAAARDGDILSQRAWGKLSFDKGAVEATTDTIFDAASLTKPVATATSILQLAERGLLHLKQPAARFFEADFGPLPHLAGIEIHHLLTHTSGLPPIPQMALTIAENEEARKDLLRAVLATPPLRPAGEGYTYSDTGYVLLGEIVLRAGGQPLDSWVRDHICAPLGLERTSFRPASSGNIAETEEGTPRNIVHDPRARALGGVAGHAGLYSTVGDLIRYAEAIRSGGAPILSQASQSRMAVSQIRPTIGGQSYGWFCAGNDYLPNGDLFSDRSYGHSGFTGCALLIDPAYDFSLVLLSNRVLNSSEDGSRFLSLRRRWLNAVAGATTRQ